MHGQGVRSASAHGACLCLDSGADQVRVAAVQNLWPLVFLAAPFAYLLPRAMAGADALILYVAFLAWTTAAVVMVARRRPGVVPLAVVRLIAGISLLDAVLIATGDAPVVAALAVAGFATTLVLQRWVAGT